MDGRLLEIIACPICKGRLQYDKQYERLICRFDHVAYSIKEGIPVLLPETAVMLNEDNHISKDIK